MAYRLGESNVQVVTVQGMLEGQQIINRYYYAYAGVLPDPDADMSNVFLTNFITAYRANILPVAWDDYTVFRYSMVEINGVKFNAGPPIRYQNIIDPSKFQQIFGVVADKGGIASAGLVKLPAHEAMRLLFTLSSRVPKRFRANYVRLSLGFPTSALAATQEQWTAGVIASVTAAYLGFLGTLITGVAAPVGSRWGLVAWSAPFWYENIRPLVPPANVLQAATRSITGAIVEPFVGTQITRRFKPLGGFRGV